MSAAASPQRIRATPYARRLARERGLPLSVIAGSGPNGRITGDDFLRRHAPLIGELAGASQPDVAANPVVVVGEAVATTPAVIVAHVEFAAIQRLLDQIAGIRPHVSREDLCLKAAAVALQETASFDSHPAILLMSPKQRRHLAGLAEAPVGAIAAMIERAAVLGDAALAVSFIGRAGIRPVMAQLVGGTPARLVIGAPDNGGCTDCLLSYDAARIGDGAAEHYLAAFRDLVEAPFRLLV